jgi:taurine dioxygenase
MTISILPTGAPVGAQVLGIDLSKPLNSATFSAIERAFNEYGVIFFRDQDLTPCQQIDFTRRFGELDYNVFSKTRGLPGVPEIIIITNILKGGEPIGLQRAGEQWHTDMCYTARPPRGSILYAHEVPQLAGMTLGDTCFASTCAAYDALPEAMRKRIDGLRATFSFRARKRGFVVTEAQTAAYPDVVHSLVRRHHKTGRACIYAMRGDCTAIDGMHDSDASVLIAALAEHITRPEFVYRHRWRVGDLLMWDNCSVQHKAIQDYALPLRRLMHRTTIVGTTTQ